jgi:hypothetical protein
MFWQAVGALLPTIGVCLLFWFVMRSIFRADQRERRALAEIELLEKQSSTGASPPGAELRSKDSG